MADETTPGSSLAVATTGRITRDNNAITMLGNAPMVLLPPPDPHNTWRALELDGHTLSRVSASRLVELMADTSPEFSRAIDDGLRLLNPGFEFKCYQLGGKNVEDDAATAAVGAILGRLRGLYGSVDVPINRLFIAMLMRGAWFGEFVVGSDKQTIVDFATPDPASVRFRKVLDEERGEIYQLGQWRATEFVSLDRPTIKYVPHDPFPGSPYGRSPLAPGIFGGLFLMGFLNDIRRVIAQQGYPRIHISINLKRLIENLPPNDRNNWKKIEEYGAALMARVQHEYARLRPEDAYVHSDIIEIDRPVGTLDASSLGMIEQVIGVLERMLVRALKTTPLMFGLTDGTSEANANRQWEIMAARIKALQHLCESPMEDLLKYALQIQGIQADVEFRFSELRSAELLRDAQVEQQEIANAREKYAAGWISQDAAAQQGANVDAADATEPRDATIAAEPMAGDINADPGSARAMRQREIANFAQLDDRGFALWCDAQRIHGTMDEPTLAAIGRERARYIAEQTETREKLTPDGAGDGFDELPDEVSFSDADRDRVTAAWDTAFPKYAGLLSASVVADEDEAA